MEEVVERLKRFKTIDVLYGNTFCMHLEQLVALQQDIDTVLQLLEQKDNKINKAISKLKEHKHDLDYEPWSIYKVDGKILFDLVEILEE